MPETYVVVSKVKKLVKESGYRTGADYIENLSKKVEELVRASVAKIQTDGSRKTLGAEDL
ncbi:MAG: hypothetical protein HY547_04955 [Elusimicrobia bacterium]|nr:hypothetical protein [Elusimicrobiota bacterium]